jgi:hypothetical protein
MKTVRGCAVRVYRMPRGAGGSRHRNLGDVGRVCSAAPSQ